MPYIEKTVSVSGTERQFIEKFIEELTSADSRITCDTSDFDEQFVKNSSVTATFTIYINGFPIVFKRLGNNNNHALSYSANYLINNVNKNLILQFASGTQYIDSITTRTWRFKVTSTDNFINIKLYSSNTDINSTTLAATQNISILTIDNKNFVSTATTTDITTAIDNKFYTYDDEETALKEYSFVNQFDYKLSERQVKIEKSKSLLNADNSLYVNFESLYDCSTVQANTFLAIDNKEYYAIDANTLVPI